MEIGDSLSLSKALKAELILTYCLTLVMLNYLNSPPIKLKSFILLYGKEETAERERGLVNRL
jgi:hypothetical protein